jgi:hypothetical protein
VNQLRSFELLDEFDQPQHIPLAPTTNTARAHVSSSCTELASSQ